MINIFLRTLNLRECGEIRAGDGRGQRFDLASLSKDFLQHFWKSRKSATGGLLFEGEGGGSRKFLRRYLCINITPETKEVRTAKVIFMRKSDAGCYCLQQRCDVDFQIIHLHRHDNAGCHVPIIVILAVTLIVVSTATAWRHQLCSICKWGDAISC